MKILNVGDKIYNFERKETIIGIEKSRTNLGILKYFTKTKNGSVNMFTSKDLTSDNKNRILLRN